MPITHRTRHLTFGVSLWSCLTFSWITPLILLGRKRPIQFSDLSSYTEQLASGSLAGGEDFLDAYEAEIQLVRSTRFIPRTVRALFRLYGRQYMRAAIGKPVWLISTLTQVYALQAIVRFLQDAPTNGGAISLAARARHIPLCVLLFAGAVGMSISQHAVFFHSTLWGGKAKAALVSALYSRALRMPPRECANVGLLHAVDAQRVLETSYYVHFVWFAGLEVTAVCVALVWELGPAAAFGVLVLFIAIPGQIWFSRKVAIARGRVVQHSEARAVKLEEGLKAITAVKHLCLESVWSDEVGAIRAREVSQLERATFFKSANSAFFFSLPVVVVLVSFAAFVFVFGNTLTPAVAFTAFSLFNVLSRILNMVQFGLIAMSESVSSFRRLDQFFDKTVQVGRVAESNSQISIQEAPPSRTIESSERTPSDCHIVMQDAEFGWEERIPALSSVSLSIQPGETVACVGKVASGKSSLIQSILGEMKCLSGMSSVSGRIAYCAQEPWILNADVRSNIALFEADGQDVDEVWYEAVVNACCLKPDFRQLPNGDRTEIGESGVNLSGGQKARIALARAVYASADIYLLDDPLSAVDVAVAKRLKDNLFGANGLLRSKAVLIVTHQVDILPLMSRVLIMEDGQVIHNAPFSSLVETGVEFAGFVEKSISMAGVEEYQEFSSGSFSHVRPVDEPVEESRQTQAKNVVTREDQRVGRVPVGVYKSYAQAIGGPTAVLAIALSFLGSQALRSGADAWIAIWAGMRIDGRNNAFYAYVYMGLGFGSMAIAILRAYIFSNRCSVGSQRLHQRLLDRVLRATPVFFEQNPSGRILNRFTADTDNVDLMLPAHAQDFLQITVYCVGSIITIAVILPIFLGPLLLVVVAFVLLQRMYVMSSRELKRIDAVSRSPVYSHIVESLTGVVTIRAYRGEKEFHSRLASLIDRTMNAFLSFNTSGRWLGVRLDFLAALVVFATSIITVLLANSIDPENAGLALVQSLTMTGILQWAVRQAAECENDFTSVERVVSMATVTPVEAALQVENSVPPQWPSAGIVSFRNVVLKYRPELDPSLQGLTFKTAPHEKLGIVGRTGAGKSTIAVALLRMVELDAGQILVDDVDLSDIGLHELRSKVAIVSQDPVVFDGTVRHNIDPRGVRLDAELVDILRRVELQASGSRFSLDARISSGGSDLSAGERQLLTLARAIATGAKVVVFDEATAHVDNATDLKIQHTVQRELQGCTVLTIAHRLDTVIGCDRILLMDAGRCIELGRPKDLLANSNGAFSMLVAETGVEQSALLRQRAGV